MKARNLVALTVVVLAAAACASSSNAPTVVRQLGTAPRAELAEKTRLVLQRNQYVIQRETLETNLMWETQWRARQPYDDEAAVGAVVAETRVIVRARPRSREANVYTANMVVENRVQLADGSWVSPPPSDEFSRYARELASELERELVQGIRVR